MGRKLTHYEVKCSRCGDKTLIVRGHDLDDVVSVMQYHENSHSKGFKEIDVLTRTSVITSVDVPEALSQLSKIREEKEKKKRELTTHPTP